MPTDRKQVRTILGILTFAILLFVGLWRLDVVLRGIGFVFSLLSFFIIGMSIAFILNTPMRLIETKLFAPLNRRLGKIWARICRPLALVITILLVLGIVLLVVFMVIPEMVRTVTMLASELPAFIGRVTIWWDSLGLDEEEVVAAFRLDEIDWVQVRNTAINLLRNGAGNVVAGTMTAATMVVSTVFNGVIGIVLALYVLFGKERLSAQFTRVLYAYVPNRRADFVLHIARTANQTFSNFISGQFLECLILGSLFFVGMSIFGFPFAPMVSVLVGATAFIPIFGAFIGCFVGAFMILVHEGFVTMMWFILFFVALQQIEGDLIYPHVVGKSLMLPGIWVLTAVTLGGNIAGILGMLISVPVSALLYTLLREAVARRTAVNKRLELGEEETTL